MKIQNNKGVALYLALMVMGILLALALGISAILLSQTKVIKEMGNSVIAFYAANTGIERELYEGNYLTEPTGYHYSDFLDLDGDGGGFSGAGICPDDLIDRDDACYRVTISHGGEDTCPASVSHCIKSVGVFKQTRRAIRIAR